MESSDGFLMELLESGVQIVGQPMAGVESAALGILIGTGARDEDQRQAGISHFTEQMLFRGTEHLSARELSDRLDALGISYDSSAGLEMTLVSGVMIGNRLAAAIDLLADVIRYPSFPEEDLENVRTLLLQEIRQREDQPGQKVMDGLRQEFYAGSPAGHDVLGTDESIGAIGRDDLLTYWEDRYSANNIVISIAGNFDWTAVVDQLARVTATWPAGAGRMVFHEPKPNIGIKVVKREASQENIGFAFPAVPAGDPHFYAAALASQAFGGGPNSRLFNEVREARGLAYSVSCRFDALEKTGLFRLYVGTSAERAHESVEVVLQELAKFETGGISDEELARAKIKLKSQLVMRSESTSARMGANLRSWWSEQKLYTLDEIKVLIDHVTTEEIATLLQNLHATDNLAAFALGPRSEEELFGGVLVES